jgi:hypothetical protein
MKQKKSKTFEMQLFQAMKSSGLLFPSSDKQVTEFEQKFGKTVLTLPSELQDSSSVTNPSKRKINQSLTKMAAFSKKPKFDGSKGSR